MDNLRADILFTLSSWETNSTWDQTSNNPIIRTETIWMDLSEFQYYQTLSPNGKVAFLLEKKWEFSF